MVLFELRFKPLFELDIDLVIGIFFGAFCISSDVDIRYFLFCSDLQLM